MAIGYILGFLAAHPSWIVAYVCVSVVATVVALYYAIDDGTSPARPRHKAPSRAGRGARLRFPYDLTGKNLSPQDAATVAWAAALHHEDGAEPWHTSTAPGNIVPAFAAAPTEDLGPGTPACAGAIDSPKADSPAPAGVPGPEVGTADRAHGDPVAVAGDQDPAAAAISQNAPPPPVIRDDYVAPAADAIACRSCVTTDGGLVCQADLGGQCPSDPASYVPPPVTPLDKALAAVADRADEIKAIRAESTSTYLQRLDRTWDEDTGTWSRELLGAALAGGA